MTKGPRKHTALRSRQTTLTPFQPGVWKFSMELQVLSQLEFYVAQLTLARHRNLARYFHTVAKIKVCCIKNYCQSLPYPSFSFTNLNLENTLTAKLLLLQFKSILILLAHKNCKIFGRNKLNKDKRKEDQKKKKNQSKDVHTTREHTRVQKQL